jgi:uncharacterized protein YsxB (DUF464 family)
MIKVELKNNVDNQTINISGHAMFGEYGTDIVCAATSMLVFTIANQILKINKNFNVTIDVNDITFINDKKNSEINLLIDTMITGFDMLVEEYGEFISFSIKN